MSINAFIQKHLFAITPDMIVARAESGVSETINDSRAKMTEVIRDNGTVHGRVHPVVRDSSSTTQTLLW